MIPVPVDPRIPLGAHRVKTSEMANQGWNGFLARLFNRLRVILEKRAGHHAMMVMMYREPLAVEQAVQTFSSEGRFRELRGSVHIPETFPAPEETMPPDLQILHKLARLTETGRAKRYREGRRIFRFYDVEEEPSHEEAHK